jgi:transposase
MASLNLTAWQRRRLRRQLRQTRDAHVYRRTLAVLEVARGKPVSGVAEALGVSRQSVHNWLADYLQGRDPAGLHDAPRCGRPSLWTDDARAMLPALLGHDPQQLGWQQANWTVGLLGQELLLRCGQELSEDTIRRELRRQGFVWKRPRYVLDPDPERDKKTPHPPADSRAAAAQRAAGRR